MTIVSERTGSTLGGYEDLTSLEEELVSRRTPARDVPNHGLEDVLTGFDVALTEPMAPLRTFIVVDNVATGASISGIGHGLVAAPIAGLLTTAMSHAIRLLTVVAVPSAAVQRVSDPFLVGISPETASGADDVVAAIKGLSWRLGLPQRDICEAADVSRSAYYTWSQPDAPRPRVASQGRLWALVQFTEDLEELLDVPPSQWLLSDQDRREQLLDGRFNELLESLRARPQPSRAAPDYARFLSAGGDRLASDNEPAAVRRPHRRVTSAQPVSRSRSRKK